MNNNTVQRLIAMIEGRSPDAVSTPRPSSNAPVPSPFLNNMVVNSPQAALEETTQLLAAHLINQLAQGFQMNLLQSQIDAYQNQIYSPQNQLNASQNQENITQATDQKAQPRLKDPPRNDNSPIAVATTTKDKVINRDTATKPKVDVKNPKETKKSKAAKASLLESKMSSKPEGKSSSQTPLGNTKSEKATPATAPPASKRARLTIKESRRRNPLRAASSVKNFRFDPSNPSQTVKRAAAKPPEDQTNERKNTKKRRTSGETTPKTRTSNENTPIIVNKGRSLGSILKSWTQITAIHKELGGKASRHTPNTAPAKTSVSHQSRHKDDSGGILAALKDFESPMTNRKRKRRLEENITSSISASKKATSDFQSKAKEAVKIDSNKPNLQKKDDTEKEKKSGRAFNLFCQDRMASIKEKNPELTNNELVALAANIWKMASHKEKRPFQEQALGEILQKRDKTNADDKAQQPEAAEGKSDEEETIEMVKESFLKEPKLERESSSSKLQANKDLSSLPESPNLQSIDERGEDSNLSSRDDKAREESDSVDNCSHRSYKKPQGKDCTKLLAAFNESASPSEEGGDQIKDPGVKAADDENSCAVEYVACGTCQNCRTEKDCGNCLNCKLLPSYIRTFPCDKQEHQIFKPICVTRICIQPIKNQCDGQQQQIDHETSNKAEKTRPKKEQANEKSKKEGRTEKDLVFDCLQRYQNMRQMVSNTPASGKGGVSTLGEVESLSSASSCESMSDLEEDPPKDPPKDPPEIETKKENLTAADLARKMRKAARSEFFSTMDETVSA